jgi:hypothetical protein
VFPGHADLTEVPRQTADDAWLPIVGTRRLVVITRDKRIRYRPVERMAWVSDGVRGFVLTGRLSQNTAQSLSLLETHWERIESIIGDEQTGPWMRSITTSGIKEISLQR